MGVSGWEEEALACMAGHYTTSPAAMQAPPDVRAVTDKVLDRVSRHEELRVARAQQCRLLDDGGQCAQDA